MVYEKCSSLDLLRSLVDKPLFSSFPRPEPNLRGRPRRLPNNLCHLEGLGNLLAWTRSRRAFRGWAVRASNRAQVPMSDSLVHSRRRQSPGVRSNCRPSTSFDVQTLNNRAIKIPTPHSVRRLLGAPTSTRRFARC